jgi:hypothetical protein
MDNAEEMEMLTAKERQYEETTVSNNNYKKFGVAALLLFGSSVLYAANRDSSKKVKSVENMESEMTSTTTSIGMWNEYTELDGNGIPIDLDSLPYYTILSDSKVVEPHRITTLKVFGDYDEATTKFAWDIRRETKVTETSQDKPPEPLSERVWGRTIERVFASAGYHYDVKVTIYTTADAFNSNTMALVKSASFKQKATCLYVRREIRALNHVDRAELLAAMWVPYSTSMEDGVAKYGDEYMDIASINSMHNYWAADYECDHLHDGSGFATQHLALTIRYEAAIQAINPKIVMPYWEYTIESANIITNHNSNYDKFYELSVVFSSEWFGPFDTQQEPWSEIQLAKSTVRNNVFGLSRAPWNFAHETKILRYRERCGFNTAKMLMDMEAPSSCSSFASALEEGSFEDFQTELMHAPHGSIHIMLGGISGGCDHTYKDQLKDYFSDSAIAKIAQLSAISLKGIWRAGFVDYSKCTLDSEDMCEQACVGGDFIAIGQAVFDLYNGWDISPRDKADPDAYLAALGKVHCGTKLSIGDMYSSSATIDPLFWVMHTTTDRLMSFKRAKEFSFTDSTWSDSNCFGHSPGDNVIFDISGLVGSGSLLTNYDLLVASDPQSADYGMNYIYDSFDYSHCDFEKYPALTRDYYPTDEELAVRAQKKTVFRSSMLG